MIISKVEVENFRTFRKSEANLRDFNLLIGANASGKSNFLDIIKFLSDVAESNLEDAISIQGGIQEIVNQKIGHEKDVSLDFEINEVDEIAPFPTPIESDELEHKYAFFMKGFEYGISIDSTEEGYEVSREQIRISYEMREWKENEEELESTEHKAELTLFRDKEGFDWGVNLSDEFEDNIGSQKEEIRNELQIDAILERYNVGSKKLLISSNSPLNLVFSPVLQKLTQMSIYDIHPHKVRESTTFSGKKELEEDGSNLSIVLKDIEEDEEEKEKFRQFAQDLLPFVKDVTIEKTADRSLFFKLKELFGEESKEKEDYAPSSMISDGTVNIFSLIIALFFEKNAIIGIEEPERNIHSSLISKIVNYMEEAANRKQIIATTHNHELLKNTSKENVKVIRRNDEGYSEIINPHDEKKFRDFLENDIGLEQIQRDNLM